MLDRYELKGVLCELISLFINHDTKKINISIEDEEGYRKVSMRIRESEIDQKTLNEVKKVLSLERYEEVSGYYHELLGGDFENEHLSLISDMIDRVEILHHPQEEIELIMYRDK